MQASTLQWSLQLSIYRTSVWGHNRIIWISKTWRALLLDTIISLNSYLKLNSLQKYCSWNWFLSQWYHKFSLLSSLEDGFFFPIVYVSKNSDNIDQVPLPCLLKFPFRLWEANLTGHVVTLLPLFDCLPEDKVTREKQKGKLERIKENHLWLYFAYQNSTNQILTSLYFWEN